MKKTPEYYVHMAKQGSKKDLGKLITSIHHLRWETQHIT